MRKIKKLAAVLLSGIMAFSAMNVASVLVSAAEISSVSAAQSEASDFACTVLDDGTAEITKYSGKDAVVVIPSEIDGIKVTSIGYGAFNYNDTAESVTIPDGVTNIGELAFNNCLALKSVAVPDSVTYIGSDAFSGSKLLESIVITKGVKNIESQTFRDCQGLKSVVLPEGLEKISTMAFKDCKALESISLPETLTYIDFGAFDSCFALNDITIPKSVTYISDFAIGYNMNYFMKIDGVVIRGVAGSAAEEYANINGFEFVEIVKETIIGDADGDGKISIDDVTCIQKYCAALSVDFIDLNLADVNYDGVINIDDTTLIQKHLANLIDLNATAN